MQTINVCVGARAYHLHRVLHDWPDAECLTILTHLREAMSGGEPVSRESKKKSYSKLLIFDFVIPDLNAKASSTGSDLVMMVINAACERTETAWKTLLQQAGFRILKIWPVQEGSESLIEAEIA